MFRVAALWTNANSHFKFYTAPQRSNSSKFSTFVVPKVPPVFSAIGRYFAGGKTKMSFFLRIALNLVSNNIEFFYRIYTLILQIFHVLLKIYTACLHRNDSLFPRETCPLTHAMCVRKSRDKLIL